MIFLEMLRFAENLDKQEKYKVSDAIVDLAQLSTSEQKAYISSKQAEALYAFMGWLTTREAESGPFGANNNCAPAAELVSRFCDSQGWEILPEERDSGGNIEHAWVDDFKPYPNDKHDHVTASRKMQLASLIGDDEHVPVPEQLKEKFNGVSCAKDKKGYYCYTHRCRSDSYDSLEKIPDSKVKFIEETG